MRRLIESMAFFSVQTRLATQHNLRSTWLRLFATFFDFLLQPLPAAAMVQAAARREDDGAGSRSPGAPSCALSPAARRGRRLPHSGATCASSPSSWRARRWCGCRLGGWRLILRFELRLRAQGPRGPAQPACAPPGRVPLLAGRLPRAAQALKQVSVVYDAHGGRASEGPVRGLLRLRPGPRPDDASALCAPAPARARLLPVARSRGSSST